MTTNDDAIGLERSVKKLIETGRFASKEDVLREGVRLIEAEDEQWTQLDAGIARSISDADAGRLKPAQEVLDRLVAKYEAMSRAV